MTMISKGTSMSIQAFVVLKVIFVARSAVHGCGVAALSCLAFEAAPARHIPDEAMLVIRCYLDERMSYKDLSVSCEVPPAMVVKGKQAGRDFSTRTLCTLS